jgi:ClpP class serine protease
MKLISEIEKGTDSRVLVLILGDRRGLETKMASDVLPFCLEHLTNFGEPKKVSLFLYSTGGVTMAGYALANLLREFSKNYDVIVPFKALSCATLITLGADNIIMTKMGQLSPIDPSVNSPLGPMAPVLSPIGQQMVNIPVNVEDVINYIELARKALGIKDEELLTRLYDRMSQNVHPLVLGSVYRSREQIGFLAQMLLERHMQDEEKIKKIIEILTRGRFSHDYLIGRKEAKDILELPIIDVDQDLNSKIVELYNQYDDLLQLSMPYHPEQMLNGESKSLGYLDRAIVETIDLTHVFRSKREVTRTEVKQPGTDIAQPVYMERNLGESWETDNSI